MAISTSASGFSDDSRTASTIGKNPIPGAVKTRLQTRYAPEQVAVLYVAFVRDVLERPGGDGQGSHTAGLRGGRDRTWPGGDGQGSHTAGRMGGEDRTRRG